ncbi:hypothetical protein DINM_005106 [Dirofilaria immitis]|nr:hypothetical protein [Dirofilaria immitis]
MSGKKQREGGILSTPRKGNSSSSEDIIGQTASTLSQQPSFTPANLLLGPQPPVRCDMGLPLSPYRFEPPPSYQTAMAYPDTSEPYLTNSDVITFSKPHGAVPPYPSLSVSNQMFLPTSPSLLASVSSQHSRAVISRSRHCPHCGQCVHFLLVYSSYVLFHAQFTDDAIIAAVLDSRRLRMNIHGFL